jgi:coproporphyrinogen III oxidase-like Fe-S oxidoreductase
VDWEALRARARDQNLEPLLDGWEAQLARFIQGGMLVREGAWLRFTPRGMLLSNGVLQMFV